MPAYLQASLVASSLLVAVVVGWRGRGRSWPARLSFGCLLLATLVLASARWQRPEYIAEADVKGRPLEIASDGYIGSSACRACHPHEHDTWHDSYHRRMTQRADAAAVIGDFDGQTLTTDGKDYHLERQGDEFWVELENPLSYLAGQPPRAKRRIVMTTGSHHMQAYWYETGHTRNLALLPFTWLVGERRWITRRAAFVGPASDPVDAKVAIWSVICLKCHATHARPRILFEGNAQNGAFTEVAEFGISCEACHGPGQRHVAANQDPTRRYSLAMADGGDPTIVNPARLPPERSTEVCGQCHASLDYRFDEPNFRRWSRDGFDYRPGDVLARSRDVKFDGEEQFWSDGLIRVAGREYNALLRSGCHDKGKMTCLSCHVMHQPGADERPRAEWADDQLHSADGDRDCLQCHEAFAADITAHTHHAVESSGSRCQNCHMPHTTYGLLKAVRTHRIASPSVQSSLATGRPNACSQCHLDRPLAWTAQALNRWYGTAIPALGDDDREVAAGVRWTLSGNAAQRALMAWSFGWGPAQEAAGSAWMVPYLAELLDDPYEAVRQIAERSLRTMPGFAAFRHDLLGPAGTGAAAKAAALATWRQTSPVVRPHDAEVLLDADGKLRMDVFTRLLRARDHRVMRLFE